MVATPELAISLLQSSDSRHIRALAARTLSELATVSHRIDAQTLETYVHDADPMVRSSIISLIGETDPAPKYIDTLTQALADPEWDVRCVAALAIGAMGERGAPCRAKLLDLLRHDHSGHVSRAAVQALGHIGVPAEPDAQIVIDIICDPTRSSFLRADAARALCAEQISPPSLKRLKLILATSLDTRRSLVQSKRVTDDVFVEIEVAALLTEVEQDEQYPAFLIDIAEAYPEDEHILKAVMNALCRLRTLGVKGVPLILRTIDSWEHDREGRYHVALAAIRALAEVSPNEGRSIVAARKAIVPGYDEHAEAALMVCAASQLQEATVVVRQSLSMPSPQIRLVAAEQYVRAGGDVREMVPIMCDLLKMHDRELCRATVTGFGRRRYLVALRARAITLLGKAGGAAEHALPIMGQLPDSEVPMLHNAIESATATILARIQPVQK